MISAYAQLGAVTEGQYRGLDAILNSGGISTEGLLSHTAFREGDQLAVFDVWESREAMDSFWAAAGVLVQNSRGAVPETQVMEVVNYRVY